MLWFDPAGSLKVAASGRLFVWYNLENKNEAREGVQTSLVLDFVAP